MAHIAYDYVEHLWDASAEKSWHGVHEVIDSARTGSRHEKIVLRVVADLERERVPFPRSAVDLHRMLADRLAEIPV